jgi:uncharacterized membrane protein
MRRSSVFLAILGITLACSRHADKTSLPPKATSGFLDRVWTVVESPGGSGDLYVFLSDGTFIRAAKEAVPDVGKWSWDGKQLSLLWAANPYTADIDSLTDSYFKLTFHFMDRSFDVGLVPATASMPDTTRTVEFEPAHSSISAMGHNPAWLVSVDGDRATFRTAKYGTLSYTGEWFDEEPNVWFFDGRPESGAETDHITLTIRQEICREDQAPAESPFTAMLDFRSDVWHGCAVAGKLASQSRVDTIPAPEKKR